MAKEMVSKKPSEKLHVFDVVNYIVFILIGLVIIFKKQLRALVEKVFEKITKDSNTVMS